MQEVQKVTSLFRTYGQGVQSMFSMRSRGRLTLYHNLTMQKRNVKSFLRLMQFILTLVVIFYGVKRFVYELVPDFLKVNVFFDYLILWGGVSLPVWCFVI